MNAANRYRPCLEVIRSRAFLAQRPRSLPPLQVREATPTFGEAVRQWLRRALSAVTGQR